VEIGDGLRDAGDVGIGCRCEAAGETGQGYGKGKSRRVMHHEMFLVAKIESIPLPANGWPPRMYAR
jgi:hypothetical protein